MINEIPGKLQNVYTSPNKTKPKKTVNTTSIYFKGAT